MISLEQKIYLETNLTLWEKNATDMAVVPIFGTIAALGKMLLGIVQLVISIAIAILCVLPGMFDKPCKDLFFYSFTVHTTSGLANLVSGAIYAIPILGSCVAFEMRTGHFCVSADNGPNLEYPYLLEYPGEDICC